MASGTAASEVLTHSRDLIGATPGAATRTNLQDEEIV
jgi:hypothetical protein